MQKQNSEIKKRLMFIQSEDFYFLTYNTILLLDTLQCIDGKRFFKDYRKIAFLIEFISSPTLVSILSKNFPSNDDIQILTKIYSNGIVRLKELNKLYYSLDKKGIIQLERRENSDEIDITLRKSQLEYDYINKVLFEIEISNIIKLQSYIKRLSGLKFDTLKNKLFLDKGVKIWQLF